MIIASQLLIIFILIINACAKQHKISFKGTIVGLIIYVAALVAVVSYTLAKNLKFDS